MKTNIKTLLEPVLDEIIAKQKPFKRKPIKVTYNYYKTDWLEFSKGAFKILIFIAFVFMVFTLIKQDNEKILDAKRELNIIPKTSGHYINTYKTNLNAPNLQTSIKYGKYNQAVTAYTSQINTMINRGYSKTRILDLLALKSMECNSYDGNCIGYKRNKDGSLFYPLTPIDVGPFQINKIHKEQFDDSLKLMKNKEWGVLYKYQLTYANGLVQSYMDIFCAKKHFDYVGLKYNNQNRFKCVAKSYNGSKRYKYTYAELGWLKREIIKKWVETNFNF